MRKASFTLILVSMTGSACEKGQTGQPPGPTITTNPARSLLPDSAW